MKDEEIGEGVGVGVGNFMCKSLLREAKDPLDKETVFLAKPWCTSV